MAAVVDTLYANQELPDTLLDRIICQKGMDKLDLSLCNIQKVPITSILTHYGKPEDLNLSFNMIRQLDLSMAIKMKPLRKLDLSRNELRVLPDNFGEMSNLVYLDIHQNCLKSLPLSMGKLDNLIYLNMAQNPFKAPLKDFFDIQKPSTNCSTAAKLVIKFLKQIATQLDGSGDTSYEDTDHENNHEDYSSQLDNTEMSTFEGGTDTDTNFNLNPFGRSMPMVEEIETSRVEKADTQKPKPRVVDVMIVIGLWLLLLPLFVAYIFDESYFDFQARKNHFNYRIWQFYGPVHRFAESILGLVRPEPALLIRGPTVEYKDLGLLGWFRNFFIEMFDYIKNSSCFLRNTN